MLRGEGGQVHEEDDLLLHVDPEPLAEVVHLRLRAVRAPDPDPSTEGLQHHVQVGGEVRVGVAHPQVAAHRAHVSHGDVAEVISEV